MVGGWTEVTAIIKFKAVRNMFGNRTMIKIWAVFGLSWSLLAFTPNVSVCGIVHCGNISNIEFGINMAYIIF